MSRTVYSRLEIRLDANGMEYEHEIYVAHSKPPHLPKTKPKIYYCPHCDKLNRALECECGGNCLPQHPTTGNC